MNKVDDNEEFHDFIMKIFINMLKSTTEKDINFLLLNESLSRAITQL